MYPASISKTFLIKMLNNKYFIISLSLLYSVGLFSLVVGFSVFLIINNKKSAQIKKTLAELKSVLQEKTNGKCQGGMIAEQINEYNNLFPLISSLEEDRNGLGRSSLQPHCHYGLLLKYIEKKSQDLLEHQCTRGGEELNKLLTEFSQVLKKASTIFGNILYMSEQRDLEDDAKKKRGEKPLYDSITLPPDSQLTIDGVENVPNSPYSPHKKHHSSYLQQINIESLTDQHELKLNSM